MGRSREGAWIEINLLQSIIAALACRSREGAWIEMCKSIAFCDDTTVAPARERGLKLLLIAISYLLSRRSREGAWIEI